MALGAGDTARVSLQLLDTVDICGRRECVLVVNISPVYGRDSLMGFNLAIRFNPEKLVFHAMLTSGTLAEGMEQRGFGAPAGELRAYAFTLTRTVSGAKPLVAFVGEYRLLCPDTVGVQLRFVEFNEEFERRRTVVVDTLPFSAVARAVDAPGRLLRTRALLREWRVETDTVTVLPLEVEYDSTLRLVAAQTVIAGISDWLSIEEVSVGGGVLYGWEQEGGSVVVSWAPQQGRSQLVLRLRVRERKADTAVLFSVTEPSDSCSCVTRWEGDTTRVVNTPSVSVAEQAAERSLLSADGHLCLEPGEGLELYDLLGRERLREMALERQRCILLRTLSPGVYIGRWHRFGESLPVVFCVQ